MAQLTKTQARDDDLKNVNLIKTLLELIEKLTNGIEIKILFPLTEAYGQRPQAVWQKKAHICISDVRRSCTRATKESHFSGGEKSRDATYQWTKNVIAALSGSES